MGLGARLQAGWRGLTGPAPDEIDALIKAGTVPTEPATEQEKTLLFDPFAIIEQLGFREKPSRINYGTLKEMASKVEILQAIIQTRINQVASFAQPSHDRYQLGFRIKVRDTEKEPTKQDKIWIREAEKLIMANGVPEDSRVRDSFEKFLRKFTRDSLVLDQGCFEIVPNRKGQPAKWFAVDAATIRLADVASTYNKDDPDQTIRYVQIYDGIIIAEYTAEEMCFGVRNPRTDIRLFGYGVSEIELLVKTVTAMLYAWEYNVAAFTKASILPGILNFKGSIPDKQLKAFRRHWYLSLSGISGAFKTPITNAEEIQWLKLKENNRDMEYSAWYDFLIKIACSQFQIDPVEVNFKYGNTGQRSGGLNEASNKEKITESKERGLRPLLRFIAGCFNAHVIWPMNEDFEFGFVGLDSKTHEDVAKINKQLVTTTRTVDELRAEDDLEPLPDGLGEVILDPAWMQNAQQAKASAEQEAAGVEGEEGEGAPDFTKLFGGDEEEGEEEEPGGKPEPKPAVVPPGEEKVKKSWNDSGRYMIDLEL